MGSAFVFETNLKEKIISLQKTEESMKQSSQKSLSATGFFFIKEIKKYTRSRGDGSWKKIHPLTKKFKTEWSKGSAASLSKRGFFSRAGVERIGDYARYKNFKSGFYNEVSFGFSDSGEDGKFDKNLLKIVKEVQRTRFIVVTRKMQKKLAAETKKRKSDKIGKDYFTFRRGKTLVFPARKIIDPVYFRQRASAELVYMETFEEDVVKRFDKQ